MSRLKSLSNSSNQRGNWGVVGTSAWGEAQGGAYSGCSLGKFSEIKFLVNYKIIPILEK